MAHVLYFFSLVLCLTSAISPFMIRYHIIPSLFDTFFVTTVDVFVVICLCAVSTFHISLFFMGQRCKCI